MSTPLSPDLKPAFQQLEQWFSAVDGTITAFSGGIDSSLVLFLSRRFLPKHKAIGCISASPSLKQRDFQLAQAFCQQYDIQLEVIQTREMEDENYLSNPHNRCYFCKSHLYQDLSVMREKYPGFWVLNGTNINDLGDYRPGLEAAKERRVHAPLADCGIDKAGVRALAKAFDLPNWDKPASPCLSSRVPYGMAITREKLRQIESAEAILLDHGFRDVRVRHYGDEARIEVPAPRLAELEACFSQVAPAIQALGFERCVMDREGLISGKLNRAL